MKQEKMLKYMNLLEDKYILEAAPKGVLPAQKRKTPDNRLIRYCALAASFVLVLGVLLTVPYWRQNDPARSNGTETPYDSIDELTKTPNSQSSPDTSMSPVGGEHMGDELYSPYNGYVDGVAYRKGTFSENYAQYMDQYDESEGEWEYDRPALMYYLTQEMDLTREDLETYYTACGYEVVPEYVYEGLLADSLEESMQLLKSEYAFYNDGKLYTVYDIYARNAIQSESPDNTLFDVTDEEYDDVWLNINEYLDSPDAYEVSDDIRQYVGEMVEQINVEVE